MLARDHQHIARDDGQLSERLFLQDDCCGAQFAFLSGRFACRNAASDDHRVSGFEIDGGGADVEESGLRAFCANSSREVNDGAQAEREKPSDWTPWKVCGRNERAWLIHGDARAFFIYESPSSAAL